MPKEKQGVKQKEGKTKPKGKITKIFKFLFGGGTEAKELVEERKTFYPKQKLSPKKQEKLDEELLQAVVDNDVEKVKLYLGLGGDANYKIKEKKTVKDIVFAENSTLLIIASEFEYTDIADELIKNGADVNTPVELGVTPLMWVARGGHRNACKLLRYHRADMNIPDMWGRTALMYAVANGHTDIYKLLIEDGADVNIQNKDGWAALMYATHNERTETVEYLLSVGANPLLKDNEGRTVYDFTKNEEIKQIIKRFENLWKMLGKEQMLLLMQNVNTTIRECSPKKMYSIVENL